MKKLFAFLLLSTVIGHAQPVATSTNLFGWDSLSPLVDIDHFEIVLFDGQSRQVGTANALTNELACAKLMGAAANGFYSLVGYSIGKDGQRSESSTNFVFQWIGVPIAPQVTPLQIVQQPVGQSVKVGQTISLTLVAVGAAPTYQWYRGGVGLYDSTNTTLWIPSAKLEDAGLYQCRIRDGAYYQTSLVVRVDVKGPPHSPGGWKIK